MNLEKRPNSSAVIIVAPAEGAKGGISTVVKSYKNSYIWTKWNCVWVESMADLKFIPKLLFSMTRYVEYLASLYSCRLVHIHVALSRSAFRKRFYFYPAKWLGKPIIVHLHAPSMSEKVAYKQFHKYGDLFVGADLVLALSESWKQVILRHLPDANVEVIMNAVQIPDSITKFEERTKSVLFLGNLNKMKGYSDLLKAFALVSEQFPEWQLHLGGNGEVSEAIELSHKLGIQDKVVVHGWVEGLQKVQLLNQSRIFCLPSYAEGFPISVLEALGYGIPVITTPVGAMQTELRGEPCVVLIEPGNVDELAGSLSDFMSAETDLLSMSHQSRALSISRFSFDEMLNKLDYFYTRYSIH
jgi:glycosyltransferase involved in cell wall biosynthesis